MYAIALVCDSIAQWHIQSNDMTAYYKWFRR